MQSAMNQVEDGGIPSLIVETTQATSIDATLRRRVEFDSLLPHVLPRFQRIAMRWLRNHEDAQDAVQEAMLSAFKHLADFDGRSQMSTWLTAILRNALRMQIRRRPTSKIVGLSDTAEKARVPISEILADPRPSSEQMIQKHQLCELVQQLKKNLPRRQQAALALRFQGEFSVKETAKMLGTSEAAVKSQLARGRATLTERFREAVRLRKRGKAGAYRETRATAASASRYKGEAAGACLAGAVVAETRMTLELGV
jgi:RNA polymerase sigma-70 factor (ECF subfamily)